MIMLIVAYVLIVIITFLAMLILAPYTRGKGVVSAPLSPDFIAQFHQQIAESEVRVKKLISFKKFPIANISDERPIIAAGNEVFVQEEKCLSLSPNVFAAGLEYEGAKVQLSYYWYMLASLIFTLFFIPITHWLAIIMQNLTVYAAGGSMYPVISLISSIIAWVDRWPLLQVPLIIFVERFFFDPLFARWLIKTVYNHGKYAHFLLEYLRYQELHTNVDIDECLRIRYQRKYLETLQKKEEAK